MRGGRGVAGGMAPECVGVRGGERYYTAYVTVPDASHAERSQFQRRRQGALLSEREPVRADTLVLSCFPHVI